MQNLISNKKGSYQMQELDLYRDLMIKKELKLLRATIEILLSI